MALVLVDVDGVLCDIESALIEHVRREYPQAERKFPGQWLVEQQFPDVPAEYIGSWFDRAGTFRSLAPLPGAKRGVAMLREAGHDVWLCSTPVANEYCASEKQQWVNEHYPLLRKRLILTSDKTLVRGNVLIDDKPEITGRMQPVWEHVYYHQSSFTWADTDRLLAYLATKDK